MPRKLLLLTWVLYPFTVIEVIVMALGWALFSAALWVYYSPLWYPPTKRTTTKYTDWAEAMDSQSALMTMTRIDEIAAKHGTKTFWLSGTLLGLERQNRPLDFDHDLDFGLFADDPTLPAFLSDIEKLPQANTVLKAQVMSLKCAIQNPDMQQMPSRIIRHIVSLKVLGDISKKPIKIDFFLHFPYRGGWMHASRNSMWWSAPFNITKKQYGERSFFVPENFHLHLTENYGDYSTEVREFENSIDCPNAMNIYSWTSFVYLLQRKKLMVKLQRHGKTKALNRRILFTLLKGLSPRSA